MNAKQAEQERIAKVLRDNPEIGVLVRKGKTVYYLVRSYGKLEHHDPAMLVSRINRELK